MSSKTRLPDNWKSCEVNQAPNLNQYQINSQCFEMSMVHVGLYKLLPKIHDSNVLPSNWKPCI